MSTEDYLTRDPEPYPGQTSIEDVLPIEGDGWRIIQADCIETMRGMDEASIDAIVCDPPYGLEFMGKEWDRLGGGERKTSKPGIGDRPTEWVSNRGWNTMRCRTCGHLSHGGSPCKCDSPDFAPADDRMRRMQQWHQRWATEALRALKPGGHLLAFGGTRTYHRLACAVEDAGFEIRDSLIWLYGSGFPKSLDVSKAIDKAAGVEWEVTRDATAELRPGDVISFDQRGSDQRGRRDTPATPEAAQWNGWGTALKPAHEPIVVARKPLIGTVSQNVLEHGTGALNIDGCRIDGPGWSKQDGDTGAGFKAEKFMGGMGRGEPTQAGGSRESDAGRWPANVVLSPEAAEELDRQSGERRSAGEYTKGARGGANDFQGPASINVDGLSAAQYGDTGGASRFFYVAKASRAERNAGLGGFEASEDKATESAHSTVCAKCRRQRVNVSGACACDEPEWIRVQQNPARNPHPTVKPIDLMRWLVRLVTPPDGTILDPFAGSGTTGAAAVLEGFDFIGIEREAEYAAIAEARIAFWAKYPGAEVDVVLGSDTHDREAGGQTSLLEGAA